MDNEHLLNEVQKLLEGMEQRFDKKLADVESRLTRRLDRLDQHAEMVTELLATIVPVTLRHETRIKKLEK